MFHLKEKQVLVYYSYVYYSYLVREIVLIISFNTLKERHVLKEQIFYHLNFVSNLK